MKQLKMTLTEVRKLLKEADSQEIEIVFDIHYSTAPDKAESKEADTDDYGEAGGKNG